MWKTRSPPTSSHREAPVNDLTYIKTDILDEHILLITLDRQETRNAFNGEMARQMESVIDAYEDNDQLWVAIVKANGPTFSAGQDLKPARTGDMGVTKKRGAFGLMRVPPEKPLIACVEGQAFAGGLEMVLSCDLIVASEDSQFALTEAKRALMAGGGGCFRLPRRIPYHIAMEMIMTGATFTARRMFHFGLVNRLEKAEETYTAAVELARLLIANSPIGVQASRTVAARSHAEHWSDAEGWKNQMPYIKKILDSQDRLEGLAAFAEKRDPVWKAR